MEYLLTFLEGMASFISPCLLPMLPIYISYFVREDEAKTNKKIINTIGFVIGFTIVFLLLAVFANSLGRIIGVNISYVKIVFGCIVILLGLNYCGVLKISFLNQTKGIKPNTKKLNFIKSVLFGMIFSVSWTPCIGAFLSSALLLISTQQELLKGMILILLYLVGLGIPLVLSVFFIEKLKTTFAWIKQYYGMITKISGILLMVMGFYIIFF